MSDNLTSIEEVIHRHMEILSTSRGIGSVVDVGKQNCRYPIIQQTCEIIPIQVKFGDYFKIGVV